MSKELMLEGAAEIERLRRQNEVLHAKVGTMELCAAFLYGKPGSEVSHGMAEDIAWKLRKQAENIEPAQLLDSVSNGDQRSL